MKKVWKQVEDGELGCRTDDVFGNNSCCLMGGVATSTFGPVGADQCKTDSLLDYVLSEIYNGELLEVYRGEALLTEKAEEMVDDLSVFSEWISACAWGGRFSGSKDILEVHGKLEELFTNLCQLYDLLALDIGILSEGGGPIRRFGEVANWFGLLDVDEARSEMVVLLKTLNL